MGVRTVAIARGRDKGNLARQLGAHIYLDSQSQDVTAELTKLGGAKTILATVTSGKAMSAVIPGLAVRGRLVVVGVGMDPIEVSALDLIGGSRTISGHASGASIDSQDTLAFSALTGVRPAIENDAAGARGRGLRQDDGQRSPVPHSTDHRTVNRKRPR
jgi:D-arabinose 1-dehydrogenase-like Zn-dependent alcohol dehydrogenase